MRRVVVFPQPDGPRRVANAPFGTSNETSSTAAALPKRFVTWRTVRCADRGGCGGGGRGPRERSDPPCEEMALTTRHPQREPSACERREDDEGDDRHRDVGNGERGRAAPVEVVHELVDADRGDRRRRREKEVDE